MFDLIGITHVLRCFMIFRLPKYIKIPPPKNLWKRSEKPIVLDPPDVENKKLKMSSTFLKSGRVKHVGHFGVPKCRDMKNIV